MSEVKTVDIRGLLDTYEFPFTLPGSGKELLIKPITTGQMKRILVYEDEVDPYIIEEALDKLISDCVITEGFNINELYLQDRFALLLEIRKVTKGEQYNFNWKCRKCTVENVSNVDLTKLNVKPFNVTENVIEINERLKFEVDFPTRGGQKDAISRVNKNQSVSLKSVEVQMGTFANSIKVVHTPDGATNEIPFEDKVYILENITAPVFERFSDWFVENDFGIEFSTQVGCIGCGHDEKLQIPLSDFFV